MFCGVVCRDVHAYLSGKGHNGEAAQDQRGQRDWAEHILVRMRQKFQLHTPKQKKNQMKTHASPKTGWVAQVWRDKYGG